MAELREQIGRRKTSQVVEILSLMKYLNSVTFNLSRALSDIKFCTGFVRLEDAEQVSGHF